MAGCPAAPSAASPDPAGTLWRFLRRSEHGCGCEHRRSVPDKDTLGDAVDRYGNSHDHRSRSLVLLRPCLIESATESRSPLAVFFLVNLNTSAFTKKLQLFIAIRQ